MNNPPSRHEYDGEGENRRKGCQANSEQSIKQFSKNTWLFRVWGSAPTPRQRAFRSPFGNLRVQTLLDFAWIVRILSPTAPFGIRLRSKCFGARRGRAKRPSTQSSVKRPGHGRNCRLRLLSGLRIGLRDGERWGGCPKPRPGFRPGPRKGQCPLTPLRFARL